MRPRASLVPTRPRNGHPRRRALLVAALCLGSAVTAADASTTQQPFRLSSSLDGKTVLPHRIHWTASIGLTPAQLGTFAFQIDGKTRWIGNKLPAVYADGNGYLVTSWLTPGKHTFTVRAYARDGRIATDTVAARTLPPPNPPAALVGTWRRTVDPTTGPELTPGHVAPAGNYTITFERRWIQDRLAGRFNRKHSGRTGEGMIIDSDWMPKQHTFHVQGDVVSFAPTAHVNQETGNSWCFPGGPGADYRWSITNQQLMLTPVTGSDACAIRGFIWTGTWERTP
jgi:hypothetical protein